jgi:glycosyltransferase involved in cell wall biosynthesis
MGGSVGPTDSDDAERVRDLEARLDVVERELARSRTLLNEAATERQSQAAELKSARRDLEGLRARRSVRVALGVSGMGRRFAAALRSVGGGGRRSGAGASKAGAASDQGRDEAADAVDPGRFREAFLASVDRGAAGGKALNVTIVGGYAVDGLAAALASTEWRVSRLGAGARPDLDPSVDVVIIGSAVFDIRDIPREPVAVAWLSDAPERWLDKPWFDEFDIVLAATDEIADLVRRRSAKVATVVPVDATEAAATVREGLRDWASSTHYGLRIGVPKWDVTERWGDYHFARALQRSLERSGHPTRLHFRPAWEGAVAARDDVAVHILGLEEAPTRPNQVNILWQISHPDLATPTLYDRYDHVFVASDQFAARMAGSARVPVTPLHQASDPERFKPDPTGPPHELLFVANTRRVRRRIVDDLAGTNHDLAVYGRGWRPEFIDPRFVKGEGIPNDEVGRYYSSAAIVLNDHWDDMRDEGFLSNRLYDALACGAFVISDRIAGIEAEFDDAVVTYESPTDLAASIDRYLADPDERHRRGERGRAAVLARHTFDARAKVLVATVEEISRGRTPA